MRSIAFVLAAIVPLLSLASAAAETPPQILKTAICTDRNCKKGPVAYRPWELKLSLPATLGKCTVYRSTPFYAVVLLRNLRDTAERDCEDLVKDPAASAGEGLRRDAVVRFPKGNAFLRLLCTGQTPMVEYTIEGEAGTLKNFLALYSGNDRAAAERMRAAAKRWYWAASVESMTARVEIGGESCK